jgi:PadR family transcriptional regulator PadR
MVEESPWLKKFQRELNAGTVSLVLLALLDRADGPMYGYQISKRLEEQDDGTPLMKQGTLYPVLRSLDRHGLLQSEVEPSVTGPPRRYYTITTVGREELRLWIRIWSRTRDLVESVVQEVDPEPKGSEGGSNHV